MADGFGLSDILTRTVQANAKFYKGWMDLSLEYFRGISDIFGGVTEIVAPVQEMDSGGGALVLEGEAGSHVRGTFLVSNDLERSVSCDFLASDFRDPHGAGVPAKAVIRAEKHWSSRPGEQRKVQVAIGIDGSLPGVGYAGEISIRGMDGFPFRSVCDGSIESTNRRRPMISLVKSRATLKPSPSHGRPLREKQRKKGKARRPTTR